MGSALESLVGIDYARAAEGAAEIIGRGVESAGADGVVVGLSGGLDSAVVASLCASACKTLAMIMPDSGVTPDSETADARALAETLGIESRLLDIAPIVAEFSRHVEPDPEALGNARARIRMALLYYCANTRNLLVAGTSDKSEILVGYFTKHGDGAADVQPISSLYKVQVRGLARHLRIPEAIVGKKSAPYISDARTAEGELGAEYEEIDPILSCIVDGGMDDAQAAERTGAGAGTVARVRAMYESSGHKRGPACGDGWR